MKRLKQVSMALGLSLMLTIPASAGIIEIGKASPPPPSSSSTAAPGDIEIGGDVHVSGAPSGSAAEVALNLLISALSVF